MYQRAILFLADGARPDVLNEEMQKGHLPHLAQYFAAQGTNQTMLTCFPSTTGPAYLPYLTGCFPGTCNIPGIRWFDKKMYAERGWGFNSFRSYCGLEALLFDRDMNPNVTTAWDIFDQAKSIFNGVTRGIGKGADLTSRSRIWHYYYAHLTDHWKFIDDAAIRHLNQTIKGSDFDFTFLVFPSVDEYSHRSSPFHPRVRQAYADIDALVGKVVQQLKNRGLLDSTLMLLFSDHGLSETTRHFDIGPWLETEKKIKTFYYTNIFKFRFKAASMVSGNGMTHLYFEGQNGWGYRKTFEELSHTSVLLDELRFRDEVDLVVTQGTDGAVHIQTARGHGSYTVDEKNAIVRYQFERDDPLGIFPKGHPLLASGFSLDESLALTFDTHYPDIFMQMWQIFKSRRTGDVIVTSKSGFDLRERFEHPIHKASHGSLCPEHMRIPLLSNHKFHQPHIRSVDIFPTVLKLLNKPIPPGIDGRVIS